MTLAPVSCFYMDEADTVDPGDESFTNPTPPVGGITTLTATVSGLTATNPYIVITFNTPINVSSVAYAGMAQNVFLEFPVGIPITEGIHFFAITYQSKIELDLSPMLPPDPKNLVSGSTVLVELTAGINAESNNAINLTPVNVTRTLP